MIRRSVGTAEFIVIPLVDIVEDEPYSKHQLLEMFITDLLDCDYTKADIKEMLECALQHPENWLSTAELTKI
jgi:hypothetical protein